MRKYTETAADRIDENEGAGEIKARFTFEEFS